MSQPSPKKCCTTVSGSSQPVNQVSPNPSSSDTKAPSPPIIVSGPKDVCTAVLNKVLQGNLDPARLYGGCEEIENSVRRMCAAFHAGARPLKGWIANLGHGIMPGIDPDDL